MGLIRQQTYRFIAALPPLLQVDAVPAGRLLWQLTWDQMLSVELAYHRQQPGAPPDGIIVHRKYRSEESDVLVHDVRCNPTNNQVRVGKGQHSPCRGREIVMPCYAQGDSVSCEPTPRMHALTYGLGNAASGAGKTCVVTHIPHAKA